MIKFPPQEDSYLDREFCNCAFENCDSDLNKCICLQNTLGVECSIKCKCKAKCTNSNSIHGLNFNVQVSINRSLLSIKQ